MKEAPAFAIPQMIYLGAGSMPTGSLYEISNGLKRALSEAPKIQALFASAFSSLEATERFFNEEVSVPVQADGTYLIATVGDCMSPILRSGEQVAADLAAEIRPGDMTVMTHTLAVFPKVSQYIGRVHDLFVEGYGQAQPQFFHVFFQRNPACLIGVADRDLVSLHRLNAVMRADREEFASWPFDIRRHPDIEPVAIYMEEVSMPATGERPAPVEARAQFREVIALYERLAEAEIAKGLSIEEIGNKLQEVR